MNPGVRYEVVNENDFMDSSYPQLYQDVYGNDPKRREGRKGPQGELITLDEYQARKERGEKLNGYEEVYPLEKVEKIYDISKRKQGYIEVRAYVGEELVGVLQGWSCVDEGMKDKLSLEIEECLIKALGESPYSRHYLAEVFVSQNYQGNGILSGLLKRYYTKLYSNGYDSILTRTVQSKPLPMRKFEKDGFENICCYPASDERNRALFIKQLSGIGNL